ncbi:TetR/AcrR family transcriptional regulator [Sphingomonas sp. LB2R24]|uniref:TetR/AcrR family transcriptional regulator n=1 Tax=Sphingomonas sorbitolis TaxID=3096165 RepID=UPI002FC59513
MDAIVEATIQVLATDGPQRLTTTRVAKRAGVSVGTMYQYFPHKEALVYAVNERRLDSLAGAVETACEAQHGATIEQMVGTLVTTYWQAKSDRPEVMRSLCRSVAELVNEPLIAGFCRRVDRAVEAMFASAAGDGSIDLPAVNLALLATNFGAVRTFYERTLSASQIDAMHGQFTSMWVAYLREMKVSPTAPADEGPVVR